MRGKNQLLVIRILKLVFSMSNCYGYDILKEQYLFMFYHETAPASLPRKENISIIFYVNNY